MESMMTYENEFNAAVDFTLRQEGVLSNNPNDRGGLTKYGITADTFAAYKKKHPELTGWPIRVNDITTDQAIEIYHSEFWRADLPRELQLPYFDFAVNSGPGRAATLLQTAMGADADGVIGPVTLAKLAALQGPALRKLRNNFVTARLIFLADDVQHRAQDVTFIEGWVRRVTKLYDFAY
jgi:lysozyme family protein